MEARTAHDKGGKEADAAKIGMKGNDQDEVGPRSDPIGKASGHPWGKFVNPVMAGLYDAVGLDVRFVRGKGVDVWDERGVKHLDFLACYGTMPFGHHPAELWKVMHEIEESGEPIFGIPALLDAAGELAERLVGLAPKGPPDMRFAVFASSGSEAVEWAIKIARAAKHRLGILSTKNAYHGKTLGALSATGRLQYQSIFGAPAPHFDSVPFGDLEALRSKFEAQKDETQFAAFIIEPIQGEGGITVPPEGYLRSVRELCTKHGVLLIADEIQTGMGRTGRMFAYEHEQGVHPDISVLAKALGGGMQPIGAVLYSEECATMDFNLKHSSTFAGGALACRVALRTIDMLTRDDCAVVKNAQVIGGYLKERIEALRKEEARFGELLVEVRGRGLMLGIEFCGNRQRIEELFGTKTFLGVLAEQKLMGVMVSSYLLNVKRVRIANALNRMNTLRVQPPLIVTREDCDVFVAALRDVLKLLSTGNTAAFLAHIMNVQRPLEGNRKEEPIPASTKSAGPDASTRWALVVNPSDPTTYRRVDPSFELLSDAELGIFSGKMGDLLEPWAFKSSTTKISDSSFSSDGEFVFVPRTTDELLAMECEECTAEIGAGVGLAQARGAKVVGLGGGLAAVARSKGEIVEQLRRHFEKDGMRIVVEASAEEGEGASGDAAGVVFPRSWLEPNFFP